ncbi:MAG: porin [Pirellulales bacterium]|nr:porin [Pirellulales bacterium]
MQRWQWTLPIVAAVLSLACSGWALAEGRSRGPTHDAARPAAYRSIADDASYVSTAMFQQEGEGSPFMDEPTVAPAPLPEGDPGEAIVTDEPPPDAAEEGQPTDDYGGPDGRGEGGDHGAGLGATAGSWAGTSDYCTGTCGPRCNACGASARGDRGFTFGGWVDQGVTANCYHPADRFNGPVTFNDRDGEYQLNQLWVYAEKIVDTGGCGWDVGGRVDFMYGTDHRFTMARGLETNRDGSDKWNSERFYGTAMPQAYVDVAYNDLTVRMGHFFTIIGYEGVSAPNNFFYSHAYTMQYGEPFTHTGLLATYALTDRISISGGFDRGWDNWEDNNQSLSFLGGAGWTSYDQASSLTFAVSTGPYDDAGQLNRFMYSVVFSHQMTPRLLWVIQHDLGVDNNGGRTLGNGVVEDAQWYGINQYFIYRIDRAWDLGARVEWFADDDGTRVGGIGAPHGWDLGPDVGPNTQGNQIGWAGDFFAVSVGLNWKPCDNVKVRPECRWDWYRGPRDAANRLPYDAGSRAYQFTFATDLVVTF